MSPLEALGAELGAIASQISRESSLRLDAALSDLKRSTAEWELRFERLERAVSDRLASVKDGASVTVADVAPVIDEAVRAAVAAAAGEARASIKDEIAARVAELPAPKDGQDADPAAVAEALRAAMVADVDALVAERIAQIEVPAAVFDHDALAEAARQAVAQLPAPKDGADVDMDQVRALIVEEVAKQPVPKDGHTPTADEIAPLVEQAVAKAVAALPAPEPGKDADMDAVREFIRSEVASLPAPKDGETPSDDRLREIAGPVIAEAVAALPPAPAGKDADPAEVKRMVEEAVSAIPAPKDGITPSPEQIRAIVDEVVRAAVAEIPAPKDGIDGVSVDPDQVRAMVEEAVAAIPKPQDGKDGKLPVVKAWEDRVYYAGEVCSHAGATYQASVDTGRAPPHEDWTCIAAKGRDGADAEQISLCGTFVDGETYRRLSVVMLNGASFIAKKDDPGPCPGEGWQLMSQQGKRGGPGPVTKADRGTRPIKLQIADDGVLQLQMDDGSTVDCDLYPLLSRL